MGVGTVIAAVPIDGRVHGGCVREAAVIPGHAHLTPPLVVLVSDGRSVQMLPA